MNQSIKAIKETIMVTEQGEVKIPQEKCYALSSHFAQDEGVKAVVSFRGGTNKAIITTHDWKLIDDEELLIDD